MNPNTLVVVTLLVQGAAALLGMVVLRYAQHVHQHAYLRWWTWSWAAFCISLGLSAATLFLVPRVPSDHWLRLATSAGGQVAAYIQVFWLMRGTYQFSTGRDFSRWIVQASIGFIVLMTLCSTLTAFLPPGEATTSVRFFVRVGLKGFVNGMAFLAGGYWVWIRRWREKRLGGRIVGTVFLALAADYFHYFVRGILDLSGVTLHTEYLPILGFVEILLQFGMSLGLLIWMLEGEQQRLGQTTAALGQSEDRYRRLIEHSPVGICIHHNGVITYANPVAVATLGGQQPADIIGCNMLDLVPERFHDWTHAQSRKVLEEDHTFRINHGWFKRLDGREIDVEVLVHPMTHNGHKSVQVVFLDITDRLQSERRFAQAFHNSPGALCISTRREGRFLDVNDRFVKLIGYSRDRLLGQTSLGLHTWVRPEDRQDMLEVLDREGVIQGMQTWFRTATGEERAVMLSVEAIDWAGEACLLVILEDITEQKQYEQALIAAREKAEQASRLQHSILANMSHEFRTPLSGIIGFAGILSDQVEGEHRHLAELIGRSGERLLETLAAVMDLSMLESGNYPLLAETCNVYEEVWTQVAVFRPAVAEKGLAMQMEGQNGWAVLDRQGLARVLSHLLSNAVKFTFQGGIRVWVQPDGEIVRIVVEDTGVGIAPEFLPLVFDPFRQESTGWARTHEGIGLGLAITRRLVELMGGHITVQSAKDQGTRFTVVFPQVAAIHQPPARTWGHTRSEPT